MTKRKNENYVNQIINPFNKIGKNCTENIFNFLPYYEVYPISSCINKQLNNFMELFVCDYIRIKQKNIELMSKYTKNINVKDAIIKLNPSKKINDLIEKLNIKRKIMYHECYFDDVEHVIIPKNIKTVELYWCYNIHIANLVKSIKATSVENLYIFLIDVYFDNTTIKEIFANDLRELHLGSTEQNDVIDCDNLIQLFNMTNLRVLKLDNFDFYRCADLIHFKDHQLTCLELPKCNIKDDHIKNIIMPSLTKLSLAGTKITDEFAIELFKVSKKFKINITDLDLSRTKITSKCFEYLNKINLIKLKLSFCESIDNLDKLHIPLTSLSISCCNFNDDDIKNILRDPLKELDVLCNDKITDITLERIYENKLKLNRLYLYSTSITGLGVAKFLTRTGLSLSNLFVDHNIKNDCILLCSNNI